MKYLLLAGALLVAGQCHAQQINRCKNPANGELLFRSDPCPRNAQEWQAVSSGGTGNPDQRVYMSRAEAEAKIEADRRAMRRRAGQVPQQSVATGAAIKLSNASACANAKQHRDATLKAVGMARNHDLLRSLDDAVYRACK